MDRKGCVVTVALIVVMMVLLFISCESPDPVSSLNSEDKKRLITELFLVFSYGIDDAVESEDQESITIGFELEEVFWDTEFIKKGAMVSVKGSLSGGYLEVVATGKSVIGEKASLHMKFVLGEDDVDVLEVLLNGKKAPSSSWPDFSILVNADPVLLLSNENQRILTGELWLAYLYGMIVSDERFEHYGDIEFPIEVVLGEEGFIAPVLFDYSNAKYVKKGANVSIVIGEENSSEYILITAKGKHVIGRRASLRIGMVMGKSGKPAFEVRLNGQVIDKSLWPNFDVFG